MKTVLVTGATGFIGRRLVATLAARGDEVTALSRDRRGAHEAMRVVSWEPGVVEGQHAIVHLAGERAVGVRWTDKVKARILSSRVEGTRRLVDAIGKATRRPAVLVSASAVGYYGPRADTDHLDESAPPGKDFLAEVCRAWEAEASRAAEHGVRVVLARFGLVFGRGGGALEEIAKPFRMYAGGPIGDGKQVISWVHIEDAVRALLYAIDDRAVHGPINVVAPEPVTQAELARAVGAVLHRPSWLRVPASVLTLRFGEGAGPLLTGQRVIPAALRGRGFSFEWPKLVPALEECLSR